MTLTCKVLAIVACGVGFYLGESGALGAPPSKDGTALSAQNGGNAKGHARLRARIRHFARHHRHHHRHAHHGHAAKGGGGSSTTPKAN